MATSMPASRIPPAHCVACIPLPTTLLPHCLFALRARWRRNTTTRTTWHYLLLSAYYCCMDCTARTRLHGGRKPGLPRISMPSLSGSLNAGDGGRKKKKASILGTRCLCVSLAHTLPYLDTTWTVHLHFSRLTNMSQLILVWRLVGLLA